jgi:hypothetical protein
MVMISIKEFNYLIKPERVFVNTTIYMEYHLGFGVGKVSLIIYVMYVSHVIFYHACIMYEVHITYTLFNYDICE